LSKEARTIAQVIPEGDHQHSSGSLTLRPRTASAAGVILAIITRRTTWPTSPQYQRYQRHCHGHGSSGCGCQGLDFRPHSQPRS
jgi:hypothetical protein